MARECISSIEGAKEQMNRSGAEKREREVEKDGAGVGGRRRRPQSIASVLLSLSRIASRSPPARPLSASQRPCGRESWIGTGRLFGKKKGGRPSRAAASLKKERERERAAAAAAAGAAAKKGGDRPPPRRGSRQQQPLRVLYLLGLELAREVVEGPGHVPDIVLLSGVGSRGGQMKVGVS